MTFRYVFLEVKFKCRKKENFNVVKYDVEENKSNKDIGEV